MTMSLSGETDVSINKLKMAILLGDQYALSVFGRRFNQYTASQQDAIEKELAAFIDKDDVSKMDFKELENILLGGIRGTKFSSINFKDVTNQFGNNLIEFRIGGGDNYHTNFEKVSKLAIRCGAVFLSGYFPELFKKDYIKTIYRLVDRVKSGKTDADQGKEYMKPEYTNTPIAQFVKRLTSPFPRQFNSFMEQIKILVDAEQLGNGPNSIQRRALPIIVDAIKPYAVSELNMKYSSELTQLIRQVMEQYALSPRDLVSEFRDWGLYAYQDMDEVKYIYEKKFAEILKKLTRMPVSVPKEPTQPTTDSTANSEPSDDQVMKESAEDTLQTILRLIKNG
jgi:hypothetical protein